MAASSGLSWLLGHLYTLAALLPRKHCTVPTDNTVTTWQHMYIQFIYNIGLIHTHMLRKQAGCLLKWYLNGMPTAKVFPCRWYYSTKQLESLLPVSFLSSKNQVYFQNDTSVAQQTVLCKDWGKELKLYGDRTDGMFDVSSQTDTPNSSTWRLI